MYMNTNTQEVRKPNQEMKMASTKSSSTFPSRPKLLTLSLFFLSLTILLLKTSTLHPKQQGSNTTAKPRLQNEYLSKDTIQNKPKWFEIVSKEINKGKINVGLVNVDEEQVHGLGKSVFVHFDRVKKDMKWEDLFPEWIDEDEKWDAPTCPKIPMPVFEDYGGLDVVVARVPCGLLSTTAATDKGIRDVFRLQVNLVAANLVVKNGKHVDDDVDTYRPVYVVFIGACGPMLEIFRCDDLIWHEGDYWIYKPDLRRLQQKVVMPVGSCQLSPPYAEPGKEYWRKYMPNPRRLKLNPTSIYHQPREAYVTLLHSSESYVCGAIALAQSIIQTKSKKDLILLADDSIKDKSLLGLRAAGWKIKHIERIKSPHAKEGAYNEWNYSKLRIWQLTEYDKVMFIDADLIVLQNMDEYFVYPQVSAVGNDKVLFNSGVMLVEPSQCTFERLMEKRYEIASYNGGDQGFLNEVFTWWHRLPKRVNQLKHFGSADSAEHEIPDNLYAIHYLGLKPWMCYRDYDCNWDMLSRHSFASDLAHQKWWRVYDTMPESLQRYCSLTEHMDFRIRKWRGIAQNASLSDGHWKIKVTDPRQLHST